MARAQQLEEKNAISTENAEARDSHLGNRLKAVFILCFKKVSTQGFNALAEGFFPAVSFPMEIPLRKKPSGKKPPGKTDQRRNLRVMQFEYFGRAW